MAYFFDWRRMGMKCPDCDMYTKVVFENYEHVCTGCGLVLKEDNIMVSLPNIH